MICRGTEWKQRVGGGGREEKYNCNLSRTREEAGFDVCESGLSLISHEADDGWDEGR